MKCEESLAVIEEFVDGELDQQSAERLNAHLSSCATCADEYEERKREGMIYARYERDVELAPALWTAVKTRIEAEQPARAKRPHARLREWFAGALESSHFNPAWTTALVIVALGLTFGIIFYVRSQRSAPENAASNGSPQVEKPDENVAISNDGNSSQTTDENLAPRSIAQKVGESAKSRETARPNQASAKLSNSKRGASLGPSSNAPGETSSAANHVEMLEQPSLLDSQDMQTARHIENAEMLLRSFRNSQLSSGEQNPALSYEKQRSRELLADNILRRRDAETEGNIRTEELLSSLEPILLDIANLPDKPSPDDVRTIKERMQKTEIIAALQFH